MNVTITQDNSRIEQLGSNGAGIIQKLYDLAVDPNNTINLQGNIKSNYAYGYQVDYLNDKYNPDFIVSTNNRYLQFEDPNVLNMLLRQGVGDGFGITEANLNGLNIQGSDSEGSGYITFRNNTNITSFVEFKYFTNFTGGNNGPFNGCTNLKWIGLPDDQYARGGDSFFYGLPPCNIVVSSLKHYLTHDYGGAKRNRLPSFGDWNVSVDQRCDLYINDKDHKVEDVVVTSDINSTVINGFSYSNIKTITWESDQDIPAGFGKECKNLTSLVITGNVKSVGSEAFNEATNLSFSASNLSRIQSIDRQAFRKTQVSGELNLPNLTWIGQAAFQNCDQLTAVTNLGTITELPNDAISGSNITSIVLPTTIRTFRINCISRTRCSQLIFPYGVTTTSTDTLISNSLGSSIRYCQFPSTLQTFYMGNLFRDSGNNINCAFVIQATTPPNISDYSSSNNSFGYGRPSLANWYVPDSVLQTYKTATGWDRFSDKIYPISQLETDSPTNWALYQANKDYGKSNS